MPPATLGASPNPCFGKACARAALRPPSSPEIANVRIPAARLPGSASRVRQPRSARSRAQCRGRRPGENSTRRCPWTVRLSNPDGSRRDQPERIGHRMTRAAHGRRNEARALDGFVPWQGEGLGLFAAKAGFASSSQQCAGGFPPRRARHQSTRGLPTCWTNQRRRAPRRFTSCSCV